MLTPAYKTPRRYLQTMFGAQDQRTTAAQNLERAAETLAKYRALDKGGVVSYEEWQARMNELNEQADWLLQQLEVNLGDKP